MRTCTFLNRRRQEFCTECGQGIDLCKCEDPDEAAHLRLNSPEGQFLRAVGLQLDSPNQIHDYRYERLVLGVGTLGSMLVEHNRVRTPSVEAIYKQLVEIATLSARLAIEGTPEYAYPTD